MQTSSTDARRDAILDAIAFAGERLLRADDWPRGVEEVLARLGQATGVSRVYVYAVSEDGTTTSQLYEWVADGIRAFAGHPLVRDIPIVGRTAGRWFGELAQGLTMHGLLEDFAPDEQPALRIRDLQAVALTPILLEGALWGFVGFDDCTQPRRWSSSELGALRVAGTVLGSALIQQAHRAALAQSEQAYAAAYDRERRTSQELRALDGVKDALLETVSAELRTPLAVVLTFTETLAARGDALTGDERAMLVHQLHATATQMDDRLRNLLDIDRVARGSLRPDRRPVVLGAAVERAVTSCGVLHGREVEVACDGVEVVVDPQHLQRMLDLLLRNAARHTPPATPLWIGATVDDEDQVAVLHVDDEGPGVPDDRKLSVFRTPQLDDPARTFSTGLPLVAWLAVVNRGAAWVEDRPGGGASFRLSLRTA